MASQKHTIITDIPYTVTNHHPRQVLDLHLPAGLSDDSPSQPPVGLILYIHGGAFKFGSKESDLLPIRQVEENNYALAAINYRRSGEALFPAMLQDCKSAIRFLRSQEFEERYNGSGRIDTGRIVVWGESAGGHAAAFLGTTSRTHRDSTAGQGQEEDKASHFDTGDYLDVPGSSSVVGVIDYYGPTDFLAMDPYLPKGYQTHGDADSPESLYLGQTIGQVPSLVARANPCTYVEELVRAEGDKAPLFFIAHGTADRIVPEHMSLLLKDELKKHGVSVQYMPVEGADHVFKGISDEQQRELDKLTNEFLRSVFGH